MTKRDQKSDGTGSTRHAAGRMVKLGQTWRPCICTKAGSDTQKVVASQLGLLVLMSWASTLPTMEYMESGVPQKFCCFVRFVIIFPMNMAI